MVSVDVEKFPFSTLGGTLNVSEKLSASSRAMLSSISSISAHDLFPVNVSATWKATPSVHSIRNIIILIRQWPRGAYT